MRSCGSAGVASSMILQEICTPRSLGRVDCAPILRAYYLPVFVEGSMAGPTRFSDENITEPDLDTVMEQVPKGALALAGTAVLLLLIGWFFVYFVIFIPRGAVG
jgi:hypothetical protein